MSRKQTSESFWARVSIGKKSDCWEWQGACNSVGYGNVAWDGKIYVSHRISAWLSGLISDPSAPKHTTEKGYVLHKCDNRKCCNPSHFFIGNFSDNMKDAYTKKRKAQPKGANHVNAKLSAKQVIQIRKRYTKGEYQVPLAKEFGVSQRVISLVVRGESYK